MDPAVYDEDVYRNELLQKMRLSETIVYQAIFTPEKIARGEGQVFVAAMSTGFIHVYRLSQVMTPVYWDQVERHEYLC